MSKQRIVSTLAALSALAGFCLWSAVQAQTAATAAPPATVATVPGMPPVPDPKNVYSEVAAGKFSAAVLGDLERVYVPNLRSGDVYVVDPQAMKVVDRFKEFLDEVTPEDFASEG